MPIRIDAPRAWGWENCDGKLCPCSHANDIWGTATRVRILRESDYRKLLAVVRAAELLVACYRVWLTIRRRNPRGLTKGLEDALDALRGKK